MRARNPRSATAHGCHTIFASAPDPAGSRNSGSGAVRASSDREALQAHQDRAPAARPHRRSEPRAPLEARPRPLRRSDRPVSTPRRQRQAGSRGRRARARDGHGRTGRSSLRRVETVMTCAVPVRTRSGISPAKAEHEPDWQKGRATARYILRLVEPAPQRNQTNGARLRDRKHGPREAARSCGHSQCRRRPA